jgi:hypothetical protein
MYISWINIFDICTFFFVLLFAEKKNKEKGTKKEKRKTRDKKPTTMPKRV